jgi:Domain of unknown function (DUF4386)
MNVTPPLNRRLLILAGSFYLIATLSSVFGFYLIDSMTGTEEFLMTLYPERRTFSLGILLHLVNDVSVVGAGIVFFVLLQQSSLLTGTIVLGTRLLEGVILVTGKIGMLLLITLSKRYINAGTGDVREYFTELSTLVIRWNAWAFELAMIALGIGGIFLAWFLFTRKVVPRLISLIGLVGYVMLLTRSVLSIMGYGQDFTLFYGAALFELVFPVWIIVKGWRETSPGPVSPPWKSSK